jgi:uncharacterized protein (DUF362 family)
MRVKRLQESMERELAEKGRIDTAAAQRIIARASGWFHQVSGERSTLRDLLAREAGRIDLEARDLLERFLSEDDRPHTGFGRLAEGLASLPAQTLVVIELFRGVAESIFRSGVASREEVERVREAARPLAVRGRASIRRLDPRAGVVPVEQALRAAIGAIDGFAFLSTPPVGSSENRHVVLIKPGVNWGGVHGYPTVTSWEAVYAVTRMALEEADRRSASIQVVVGDESGIENKLWGGSTMENMESCRILHGAVLAGLEHAAALGPNGRTLPGATELLERARRSDPITRADVDLIDAAFRAGVRVVAFEDGEFTRIPVLGARHFTSGILVPKLVVEEVTDIVNLCKPPGRHVVLGNTGVTGAIKNHIGLLGAADRSPALHGPFDRLPAINDGENGDSFVARMQALGQAALAGEGREVAHALEHSTRFDLDLGGPGRGFQEKLVELYLAFRERERFSATDMRRTVSSFGPDVGDLMDVGVVIAALDPATLDLLGSAFLKCAYEAMASARDDALPGGDTVVEYLAGRTWLREGTAFDQTLHVAANSYGVGPIDFAHLDMVRLEDSGFSEDELAHLTRYLGG